MHTIQEASLLWCPMVRAPAQVGNTTDNHGNYLPIAVGGCNHNETGGYFLPNLCRSDRCAMWRWKPWPQPRFWSADFDKKTALTEADAGPPPPPSRAPGPWEFIPWDEDDAESRAHWRESDESRARRRKGFCGLAPLHIERE